MGIENMWDGIEKAQIFETGNYMKPGFNGVVLMKRTISKRTQKSGDAFIVEMEVVETNMPEDYAVGTKVTWFQSWKNLNAAQSSVAAWVAACFGLRRHQTVEIEREVLPGLGKMMKYATENPDTNEFVGIHLKLQTVLTTKKDGGPFTRYDFAPHDQPSAK